MIAVPSTTAIGASQPHTRRFLELESLLQPKLQCVSTVGGGPIGEVSDVFFYKPDSFRVFEVRDQEFALHFHDLLLTERTRQHDIDLEVQI